MSNQFRHEVDYKSRNFKPFKEAPWDLCGHCEAFYADLYAKNLTKTPFPPHCEKHVSNRMLSLNVSDFDTPEAYEEAQYVSDPILWAKLEFDWDARWYQEHMLSCTSTKKIYRCLSPETPILMADGSWKEIKDVVVGDWVISRNKLNQKEPRQVLTFWDNGIKQLYKITFTSGKILRLTKDHPLLASIPNDDVYSLNSTGYGGMAVARRKFINTWATIDNGLTIGTKVKSISNYLIFGNKDCPDDAVFLGYMLTDGYFGRASQTPKFTGNNILYHNELADIVSRKFNYKVSTIKRLGSEAYDTYITDGKKGTKNLANDYFRSFNLYGTKGSDKRVIKDISSWNQRSIALFINRLFAGDGCASSWTNLNRPNSGELKLTSISKDLLEAVRLLLLKFDIQSRIIYQERESLVTKNKLNKSYNLTISDGLSIKNFFTYIGFIYGKESACSQLLQQINNRRYFTRKHQKNFTWDIIKSIELDETSNVYDIEIDHNHNFIANGVVSKNCGRRLGKTEGLVVETLYEMYTRAGIDVLMIAPYERQVTRFFDEINKFIKKSIKLGGSIARYIKSPSRLELNNGSKILGFSSAATGSSRSDKIRGQDAALIVIDEIDYLLDEDIDAILAIIASRPDCKLIAASTPAGWRRKFHQFCVDKNLGFKEFWFISAESPVWTDQLQEFLAASSGGVESANFIHEYVADFAEVSEGVFKAAHLNKAIETYDMDLLGPDPETDYILGVDWNKSAGTHMCILGWKDNALTLTKKIIIPEQEYTQTAAVDKIIALQKQWNFKHVYVDAGYGATQIEMLRKASLKDRSLRFDQMLHGIHMNQHVDLVDPLTGTNITKPAKPFLVQQTAKLLEDGRLVLPLSEDTSLSGETAQQGLVQQMRNYIVEDYSVLGLPRYSQGQDHTLTAYILACGGFILSYGDFRNVPYAKRVGGVSVANRPVTVENTNPKAAQSVKEYQQEAGNPGMVLKQTTKKGGYPIDQPKDLSRDLDANRGLFQHKSLRQQVSEWKKKGRGSGGSQFRKNI